MQRLPATNTGQTQLFKIIVFDLLSRKRTPGGNAGEPISVRKSDGARKGLFSDCERTSYTTFWKIRLANSLLILIIVSSAGF